MPKLAQHPPTSKAHLQDDGRALRLAQHVRRQRRHRRQQVVF
jgi:hypothetical protein